MVGMDEMEDGALTNDELIRCWQVAKRREEVRRRILQNRYISRIRK